MKDLLSAAADMGILHLFNGKELKVTRESFGKNKTKEQINQLVFDKQLIEEATLTRAINLVNQRIAGKALQIAKRFLEARDLKGALNALENKFSKLDYSTAVKSLSAINAPCSDKDAISAMDSRKELWDEFLKRCPEIKIPEMVLLAFLTMSPLGSDSADSDLQEALTALLKRPNIVDKDVSFENLSDELIRLSDLNKKPTDDIKLANIFQVTSEFSRVKNKQKTRIKNSKNCMFHPNVFEGREHSTSDCQIVKENPSLLEKLSVSSERTQPAAAQTERGYLIHGSKRQLDEVQFVHSNESNSLVSHREGDDSSARRNNPTPETSYYVSAAGKICRSDTYPRFF